MESKSLLPPGLTFRKIVRPPRAVTICQRRADKPAWIVNINYIPYEIFREASAASAQAMIGAADPAAAQRQAFRPMMEKIAAGWNDGANFQNLASVLRSDDGIRPEIDTPEERRKFYDKYIVGGAPIDFTVDLFSRLWFESYPDKFQNVIFNELREWEDQITEEWITGKDA